MLKCVGLGDGVLNRESDANAIVALSVMARIAELTLMLKRKQSEIRVCKNQEDIYNGLGNSKAGTIRNCNIYMGFKYQLSA